MLSFLQVLLFAMIPMGSFVARVLYFNGSMDYWWTMIPLFLIPPFSFIPMLLMYFGKITPGKGGAVLDYYVLIPLIFRIIMMYIDTHFLEFNSSETVVELLIFLCMFLVNTSRRMTAEKCNYTIKEAFTENRMKNVFNDTVLQYGIASTFQLLFVVPFIGTALSIADFISGETIAMILCLIGSLFAYVVNNMVDQNDMGMFCSDTLDAKNKYKRTVGITLFAVSYVLNNFGTPKGIAKNLLKKVLKKTFKKLMKKGILGFLMSGGQEVVEVLDNLKNTFPFNMIDIEKYLPPNVLQKVQEARQNSMNAGGSGSGEL